MAKTPSIAVSLLLATCAAVAAARQPCPATVPATKAPWEWSLQERISVRFDPASMRERAEASHYQQPVRFQPAGEAATTEHPSVGEYISGDRNPELILPWELFGSLISQAFNVKEEERDYWREKFTERAKGVTLPADFWAKLDFVAQPYIEAEHRFMRDIYRIEHAKSKDEAEQIRQENEPLRRSLCSLRAVALEAARKELGSAFFDRFLYTGVAPGLVISSPNPLPAEVQLRFEAGCP